MMNALLLALLLVWALCSAYVMRKKGLSAFFALDDSAGRATLRDIIELMLALILFAGVFFSSAVIAQWALSTGPFLKISSDHKNLFQQFFATLLSAILFCFLQGVISQESIFRIYGKSSSRKASSLMRGAAVALLSYPFLMLVNSFVVSLVASFTKMPWQQQIVSTMVEKTFGEGWIFYSTLITVVVLVPFVEELVFRGAIDGFLSTLLHPFLAIAGSACIFAWLHCLPEQGAANYALFSSLFLFGVISSSLKRKEGTIFSSIGFHAAFNALSLGLLYIGSSA